MGTQIQKDKTVQPENDENQNGDDLAEMLLRQLNELPDDVIGFRVEWRKGKPVHIVLEKTKNEPNDIFIKNRAH